MTNAEANGRAHVVQWAKWCTGWETAVERNLVEPQERIEEWAQEDALSVSVRSGWFAPGAVEDVEPEEFEVLVSTGGPACRVVGDLVDGRPESVRVEVQDWGTPWTPLVLDAGERDAAAWFADRFFFGV